MTESRELESSSSSRTLENPLPTTSWNTRRTTPASWSHQNSIVEEDDQEDKGHAMASKSSLLLQGRRKRASQRSTLAIYFLTVLLSFSVLSMLFNTFFFTQEDTHPPPPGMQQGNYNSNRKSNNNHINRGRSSTMGIRLQQSLQHRPESKVAQQQQPQQPQNLDPDAPKDDETEDIHSLVGLDCTRYGGPEQTQDFVYWQDIPADSLHMSPFHRKRKNTHNHNNNNTMVPGDAGRDEYLTFEPDRGGWNNIRMAMETILALAFAMGRTLVLPPETELYLLTQKKKTRHDGDTPQRTEFSFAHFFHMDAIHQEHPGLDIITMDEFLRREGITGHFRDANNNKNNKNNNDGAVVYPPGNRTNFNGTPDQIFRWLRQYSHNVVWQPDECLAVFPKDSSSEAVEEMKQIFERMLDDDPKFEQYVGQPVPVNATSLERLKENRAGRSEMCLYDQTMQAAPYLHFPVDRAASARLLVYPYQFLFFQDYREDLWMKRFIRDHVRYSDEIQCAAARVVQAVRAKAQAYNPANTAGVYDAIHVRRGDFQYKKTRVSAPEIYEMTKRQLPENTTLYIATDERDKSFFNPLKEHYHVLFLDDFLKELGPINSNYYGMIEQLIAARGRYFFGTWFSTYTGYINRIRGYIHDREKRSGYEQGIIDSWYHVLPDRYDHMRVYYPIKQSFYAREFPTAWRMIDTDLEEFHKEIASRKTID